MILDEHQSGTVSAAGLALVVIPVPRNERWHVNRMTVLTNQATTVTTMPTATVYRGSVADGNAYDSTYTGARDSGDFDIDLQGGDQLVCQWVGGVPGTIATLSIFGSKEVV